MYLMRCSRRSSKPLAPLAALFIACSAVAAPDLPPACTVTDQVLTWKHGTEGEAPIANVDAVELRSRRVWIDASARNDSEKPLRIPLEMALDLQPNGSMSFGQAGVLFVAPHSVGHLPMSAWVAPSVARVSVVPIPGSRVDVSQTTLQLRCSRSASRYGAPSERQALLDEALELYFKNTVHPPTDVARLVRLTQGWATGAEAPTDVFWALRAMLYNAGDHHSYIVTAMERDAFYDTLTPTPPNVRLRDDGVAVVTVSQVGFDNDEGARRAYARNLFDSIASVAAKRPKGWILDLRDFGGGDMWTTLTGLSALVDGPVVGEFVSRDGREPWLVSPGRSGTTGNQDIVSISTTRSTTESGPLAVLIGPGTGSSGETTAIAFEGRPRTRFFGQPRWVSTTAELSSTHCPMARCSELPRPSTRTATDTCTKEQSRRTLSFPSPKIRSRWLLRGLLRNGVSDPNGR